MFRVRRRSSFAYRVILLVKDGDADGGHEAVAGELLLALGVLLQNLGEAVKVMIP